MKLFTITYTKNGSNPREYLIPARTKADALVRLGQIYGDKQDRDDIEIKIISVKP